MIKATSVVVKFLSDDGKESSRVSVPINSTREQLDLILNDLIEDEQQYSFFIDGHEILKSIECTIYDNKINQENILMILYKPRSLFRVRCVTRCTSSLPGHKEAILVVRFSQDGRQLATGSGDNSIRLQDLNTETPSFVLKGHKGWVQCLEWSPPATILASGCKENLLILQNPLTGKAIRRPMIIHKQGIMSLSQEPFHKNSNCDKIVTGGKDGLIKIHQINQGKVLFVLSGHTAAVTCVLQGGEDFIYSSSRDRTVRVWNSLNGKLLRILEGHGHQVNHISLSTEYALRTGPFDYTKSNNKTNAFENYKKALSNQGELLVSASDDNTAFLWNPIFSQKPVNRLLGHQQPISFVRFSPDGRYITTVSFDKSIRLWEGRTGKYLSTFRGHVGAVYQISWSADSKIFVTGSKDSTIKIQDVSSKKRLADLPGHADEVFAVDWSPDGKRVASGGRDTILKIQRK